MIFAEDVRIEKKDSIVILVNTFNGNWFRLTQECFEVIEQLIQSNYKCEKILEKIVDSEDRKYFEKTFAHLIKIGILVENEDISNKLSVGFSVTHRCNLYCKHCSYNAGVRMENELVDDKDIIRILKRIISLNPISISITGGEPLLRDNIDGIMDVLKKEYNGHCNLMTNGTLISRDNIEKLVDVFDSFDISLDGIDEKTCSIVRGEGVYEKVIKSVELLKSRGVNANNIALSMVLTSENEKYVDEFEKLNEKLGTRNIIREYSYIGRGGESKLFEINSADLEKIEGIGIGNCMNCGAMKSEMYVNCDGEVYPCPMIIDKKYSLGNILFIEEFKQFVYEKKYKNTKGYKMFENDFFPEKIECSTCESKYFCITCPVQHYQHRKQKYFREYCKIKKQSYSALWVR